MHPQNFKQKRQKKSQILTFEALSYPLMLYLKQDSIMPMEFGSNIEDSSIVRLWLSEHSFGRFTNNSALPSLRKQWYQFPLLGCESSISHN